MELLSRVKSAKDLPGSTPNEKLESMANIIIQDPTLGHFEKAKANMAWAAIKGFLPTDQDPASQEGHALEAARFLAGLFGYDVEFIKEQGKSPLQELREVHAIQSQPGNYDQGEYMTGLFNGLELALAIFEKRDPNYRDVKTGEENAVYCVGGCEKCSPQKTTTQTDPAPTY